MPGDDLALYQFPKDATPAEAVTHLFYAWERRGRGWWVWPYPVELEPPFRTLIPEFRGAAGTTSGPVDDARKPTLLSRLGDRVRGRSAPTPAAAGELVIEEPSPEPFTDSSELVALEIALRPDVKIPLDLSERFLLSLRACTAPVSFEVVGTADAITIQLTCREGDRGTLRAQLQAHFPDAVVTEDRDALLLAWASEQRNTVTIDFGLAHEFMRPLRTVRSLDPDPLIAVSGALADLQVGEAGAFQILFQRCRAPWAEHVLDAVTDEQGGSFFADAPEMLTLAETKVAQPFFAAALRVAAKSPEADRAWTIVRALAGALAQFGDPRGNELIPLSPEGLEDEDPEYLVLSRLTRRSGMLLNSEELVSLVHLPSVSVRAPKLAREVRTTKAAPRAATGHRLVLGETRHGGKTMAVTVSPAQRSRHMHLIGASGTGKSHLLLSLIDQDLAAGEGVGVLDPHGDLVEQALTLVPDRRRDEVILFDPADEEGPVGFNVFHAASPQEQHLLASDLVAVFQRLSTSWGDQMTAVLSNAVLAVLESEQGGTLADVRRFLSDADFRRAFLRTVRDPEVVYFWEKEFPLLAGKPQGPILTRLNAFLRHRLVRRVVAQRENRFDVANVMNEGKVFFAKLAQGRIGEENARLLGTLLLSKFHQVALTRQEFAEEHRRPFYLYVDEFHHFATPSLSAILSGARKYRLGLILAHQDLEQLRSRNPELLSAVLTNPAIRVCFRVGDLDATKLADGFSTFGPQDLRRLGVGDAICRVERSDWDFNLHTLPLAKIDPSTAVSRREAVAAQSRARYGTPVAAIEGTPKPADEARPIEEQRPDEGPPPVKLSKRKTKEQAVTGDAATALPGRGGPQHKYLQSLVRKLAEERGFQVTVEKMVLGGHGHIDVVLEREGFAVACEIAVTTRVEHEMKNLTKCFAAGFDYAVLVCAEPRLLEAARGQWGKADDRVRLVVPDDLIAFLDELVQATGIAVPPETLTPEGKKPTGPGRAEAPLSPDAKKRLLIAKDAAAYIGLAGQTLAKMRVTGDSPPFHKVGRRVLYDRADLDRWLAERRRRSTSDAGKRNH